MDLEDTGQGFVVSFSWLVRDGTLIGAPRPPDIEGNYACVGMRTGCHGAQCLAGVLWRTRWSRVAGRFRCPHRAPLGVLIFGKPEKRAVRGGRGRAGVQREYDAGGELLEVRSRTAVRGGWVGGRM